MSFKSKYFHFIRTDSRDKTPGGTSSWVLKKKETVVSPQFSCGMQVYSQKTAYC